MKNPIIIFYLIIFIIVILFVPSIYSNGSSNPFIFPIKNEYVITSYFGYREAPTSWASTYHSGIDIAVPAGSEVYSVFSGTVKNLGFLGSGGYTIIIENEEYRALYCHLSKDFYFSIGDKVEVGDLIATVGEKNVYDVPNNPYKDSNGEPTNGATTGPHLHLSLYKNGELINPSDILEF
jgi:murein DD-endopeptidase MepM/ murein hydrolase activator NlpD